MRTAGKWYRVCILPDFAVFLCLYCCFVLTGCEEISPTGIKFDHKQHLGRGGTCGLCHRFFSDDEPSRPAERICGFCHDIGERSQPSKACAFCHTRLDLSAGSVPRPAYGDSTFRHKVHENAGISCRECHRNQEAARTYADIVFPAMKSCIFCHAEKDVKRDCKVCHRVWREDQKPDTHRHDWKQRHGSMAQERYESNCNYCHSRKQFCQDCHMAETPDSHTLFFKNRGHGFWAETARMRCLPCHPQDFCLECHGPESDVKPPSHRGGFGGRRPYLHCLNCHFPSGMIYGCNACHNSDIIQMKHVEAAEEKSAPIPEAVFGISRNCLNACHPFEKVPFNHPVGALNNNDCLRCHGP